MNLITSYSGEFCSVNCDYEVDCNSHGVCTEYIFYSSINIVMLVVFVSRIIMVNIVRRHVMIRKIVPIMVFVSMMECAYVMKDMKELIVKQNQKNHLLNMMFYSWLFFWFFLQFSYSYSINTLYFFSILSLISRNNHDSLRNCNSFSSLSFIL